MTVPFDARRAAMPQPAAVLLLLAFAPLLATSRSAIEAIWVVFAVAVVLTIIAAIARLGGTRLPDEFRLGVAAPLAAAAVAMLDLLTAAFVPDVHSALVDDLPLVAASSLLFAAGFQCLGNAHAPRSIAGALDTACIAGVSFVALGATREWLGHLAQLAVQPAGALLLVGIGLAACNGIRLRRTRPGATASRGATNS